MIKSMTGYGRGKSEGNGREYVVEIKAINHRYNDISIKMPRYLSFLEDKVRQYVSKSILRGKTEIFITVNNMGGVSKDINIDKDLAGTYISEMRKLIEEYNLKDEISVTSILRLPDIITMPNNEDEDLYWDSLKNAIDIAVQNLTSAKI